MSTSSLLTVKQLSEKHPAFSCGSLRWIIFRSADNTDPTYSKFRSSIHKIGSRVLIDESRFLAIAMNRDEMDAVQ